MTKQTADTIHYLEEIEKRATEAPWSIPHLSTARAGLHESSDPIFGEQKREDCRCGYVLSDGYMGAVCEVFTSPDRNIKNGDNPPLEEAKANGELISLSRNSFRALINCAKALKQAEPNLTDPQDADFANQALKELDESVKFTVGHKDNL